MIFKTYILKARSRRSKGLKPRALRRPLKWRKALYAKAT